MHAGFSSVGAPPDFAVASHGDSVSHNIKVAAVFFSEEL